MPLPSLTALSLDEEEVVEKGMASTGGGYEKECWVLVEGKTVRNAAPVQQQTKTHAASLLDRDCAELECTGMKTDTQMEFETESSIIYVLQDSGFRIR